MGVAACVGGSDVSGRTSRELGFCDGGARSGLPRHSGGRVRGDRIPPARDALAVDLDSARHPAARRVPDPAFLSVAGAGSAAGTDGRGYESDGGITKRVVSQFELESAKRRSATTDQIASTTPNGHAPARKP